jgi:hypothetical protein
MAVKRIEYHRQESTQPSDHWITGDVTRTDDSAVRKLLKNNKITANSVK